MKCAVDTSQCMRSVLDLYHATGGMISTAICVPCCPAAHPDGTSEYNAHNLYGTSMARHFHNTYKDVSGKRVFLLTR